MQYGVALPNIGAGGDPRTLAELASTAEMAGWDGVFVWDSLYVNIDDPKYLAIYDPWIALSAIAMRTERLRIGTMLTPLARRRPWKVARETVSLDHLSHGRLILPVGLGTLDDGGFSKVGEKLERKVRAQLLDESLDILTGLWTGQPFSYQGEHYNVQEMTFLPTPVQSPRIPIWVVGAWQRVKSMERVLRYDGIIPTKLNNDSSLAEMTPTDISAMKTFIDAHRPQGTLFDIVWEGETPGDDQALVSETVRPWAEAGITWWLESVWKTPEALGGVEGMRTRIKQGPPRI